MTGCSPGEKSLTGQTKNNKQKNCNCNSKLARPPAVRNMVYPICYADSDVKSIPLRHAVKSVSKRPIFKKNLTHHLEVHEGIVPRMRKETRKITTDHHTNFMPISLSIGEKYTTWQTNKQQTTYPPQSHTIIWPLFSLKPMHCYCVNLNTP